MVEMFEPLLEEPNLKLVSLMEHTPGLRADLVRARLSGETPSVIAVWREGERVA